MGRDGDIIGHGNTNVIKRSPGFDCPWLKICPDRNAR